MSNYALKFGPVYGWNVKQRRRVARAAKKVYPEYLRRMERLATERAAELMAIEFPPAPESK